MFPNDDDISVLLESSLKELESSKGWKSSLGSSPNVVVDQGKGNFSETSKQHHHSYCLKNTANTSKSHIMNNKMFPPRSSSRISHTLPRIRKKTMAARPSAFQFLGGSSGGIALLVADFFHSWARSFIYTTATLNNNTNHALSSYDELEQKIPQGHDFLTFLEHGTPHYQLSPNATTTTTRSLLVRPMVVLIRKEKYYHCCQWKKRNLLLMILVTVVVCTVTRDFRKVSVAHRQASLDGQQEGGTTSAAPPRQQHNLIHGKNNNDRLAVRGGGGGGGKLRGISVQAPTITNVTAMQRWVKANNHSVIISSESRTSPTTAAAKHVENEQVTNSVAATTATDVSPTATSSFQSKQSHAASAGGMDNGLMNEEAVEEQQSSSNSRLGATTITTRTAWVTSPFQLWKPRKRGDSNKPPPLPLITPPGTIEMLRVHPRFRTISRSDYVQAVKELSNSISQSSQESATPTTAQPST